MADVDMKDDGKEKMQDTAMEDTGTPPKDKEQQKMFSLKKWNAIAMWSWDVECDTCAICRVQVMGKNISPKFKFLSLYACLRCQSDNKQEECVVVWGECNHSFHNCCMSLWIVQNNRCPLCQQEWVVQRIGR
ncbi:hypothetical protein QZH41_011369 [Actinostola sp. cb2023]|nr:hypothetical protein QZH41_011369 [Actinostola sp. cb2023]